MKHSAVPTEPGGGEHGRLGWHMKHRQHTSVKKSLKYSNAVWGNMCVPSAYEPHGLDLDLGGL
jgi:hypothetical protein